MSSQHDKYTWFKNNSDVNWITSRSHRGFTGSITYVSGTGYTLTITGTGAPAAATYPTLKNAKNAYRKFLRTKPVT